MSFESNTIKVEIVMSDFKSYKDLDIYTISMDLFLALHPQTLKLPK